MVFNKIKKAVQGIGHVAVLCTALVSPAFAGDEIVIDTGRRDPVPAMESEAASPVDAINSEPNPTLRRKLQTEAGLPITTDPVGNDTYLFGGEEEEEESREAPSLDRKTEDPSPSKLREAVFDLNYDANGFSERVALRKVKRDGLSYIVSGNHSAKTNRFLEGAGEAVDTQSAGISTTGFYRGAKDSIDYTVVVSADGSTMIEGKGNDSNGLKGGLTLVHRDSRLGLSLWERVRNLEGPNRDTTDTNTGVSGSWSGNYKDIGLRLNGGRTTNNTNQVTGAEDKRINSSHKKTTDNYTISTHWKDIDATYSMRNEQRDTAQETKSHRARLSFPVGNARLYLGHNWTGGWLTDNSLRLRFMNSGLRELTENIEEAGDPESAKTSLDSEVRTNLVRETSYFDGILSEGKDERTGITNTRVGVQYGKITDGNGWRISLTQNHFRRGAETNNTYDVSFGKHNKDSGWDANVSTGDNTRVNITYRWNF